MSTTVTGSADPGTGGNTAVQSPAAQNPAAPSAAAQSPGAQSPAAQSPGAQSPAAQTAAAQHPGTRNGSSRPNRARAGAAARATHADLRRLDGELEALDRAETLLREARALRSTDPRTAFELTHRALLRTAGVVIDRANRERIRRLPLNVWTALSRCGAMNRGWAIEAAPFVTERARLAGRSDAAPDPALLDSHLETTAQRIAAVRAETMVALLPGGSW